MFKFKFIQFDSFQTSNIIFVICQCARRFMFRVVLQDFWLPLKLKVYYIVSMLVGTTSFIPSGVISFPPRTISQESWILCSRYDLAYPPELTSTTPSIGMIISTIKFYKTHLRFGSLYVSLNLRFIFYFIFNKNTLC